MGKYLHRERSVLKTVGFEQNLIRELVTSNLGRTEFEWESMCVEKDLFGKLLGRIEFDWQTICIELGSNRICLAKYLRRERSVCKSVGVKQNPIGNVPGRRQNSFKISKIHPCPQWPIFNDDYVGTVDLNRAGSYFIVFMVIGDEKK